MASPGAAARYVAVEPDGLVVLDTSTTAPFDPEGIGHPAPRVMLSRVPTVRHRTPGVRVL
jgi:hypothetical protein